MSSEVIRSGRNERQRRLLSILESMATLQLITVTLLVGSFTVWDRLHPQRSAQGSYSEPPLPKELVPIRGAPTLGNPQAKVALILFSDFQCPFCARSEREVLPLLDRQYLRPGRALLVWRHYPLPIHKNAQKAAEAAECASRQGKFWEFHDWAFQHQSDLGVAALKAAVEGLGINPVTFDTCLDGQATARIQADVALGDKVVLEGTPAWLIGLIQQDGNVTVTDRLTGARPFTEFQKVLDKAIAASGRLAKR